MNAYSEGPLSPAGPAQSEYLIHFCGRAPGLKFTPFVPDWIRGITPAQRLDNILWQQCIWGFPPFGAESPMVCFSESPADHLVWLMNDRHWPPWGVFLTRQRVYAAGGGPVWYARPGQYAKMAPDQLAWSVRLGTTWGQPRSEWLHEREWRLPVPAENPALSLAPGVITAVLVGNPAWQPSVRLVQQPTGYYVDVSTGQPTPPDNPLAEPQMHQISAYPPLWGTCPRWYWDPGAQRFIVVLAGASSTNEADCEC